MTQPAAPELNGLNDTQLQAINDGSNLWLELSKEAREDELRELGVFPQAVPPETQSLKLQ